MKTEDRVILSQTDERERNALISEYTSFIKSSASKATGRFITENDDEFSVALIAFNEAADRYNPDKGNFLNFASLVIKSRISDYLRKGKNDPLPFSSLAEEDEEIEVVGLTDVVSDAATEIKILTEKLSEYDISFEALARSVPVSRKTRLAVGDVIKYILKDDIRAKQVIDSGRLPVTEIIENVPVNKKIPERHRKYIIAAVVILTGEYEHVKPYIMGIFKAGRC